MSEPADANELARFHDVRAGYSHPVVGPVSFGIRPGEILGLAGANGAGKSTLLNALTGAARIFQGRIDRHPKLTVSHHRQRPELPPELPLLGRELMALLDADSSRAPALLQPLLDKPLSRFSGGQFQFLQACACVTSPARLVILDEPTNNLDGLAIESLSTLLSTLGPDRAALLVSHEHEFLRQHCTRLVELPLAG